MSDTYPDDKNYAGLATAEEMSDARRWLEGMLGALIGAEESRNTGVEIVCVSQGWGEMQTGVAMDKTPLCLNGTFYSSGIGTHADSEILIRLPAGVRRLTGLCGINDSPETRANSKALTFSVEIEGREVWRSGPQRVSDPPARFDADLAGHKQFTLMVKGPINYAHADWVDLKVALSNGNRLVIGRASSGGQVGFSFDYNGKSSHDLLRTWRVKQQRRMMKNEIVMRRIICTDPKTGLAAICDLKEYTRFPVLEWILRLKNTSRRTTPLIKDVRSLDATLWLGAYPYLNYWTGDYCAPDGYEPFRVSLAHGEEYRFAPMGGRPTNRAWPYYNLDCPASNRGLIVAIGWPGQWSACFRGIGNHVIHIAAGQERTRFQLLPGEEVRTPLSVLMFYRGDKIRSQNLWRRWMFAHNLPRPGGRLPAPMLPAYCAAGSLGTEMALETEETQLASIDRYGGEGITLDYWWMDAGWYECDGQWLKTGTWEPDAKRFPRGLRPVCDRAHAAGMKTLVWFEPERVRPDTWLWQHHPEWLLNVKETDNRLLDLGNPAALKWLIGHVSKTLVVQGIDLYRQDFNFEPLPYWQAHDARDRQGITEIRHVEGYLAFWFALRKRFPDMLIDSCASGGRRNDLETMRLGVPLHKTDYGYEDQTVKQAFHHTLSSWLPYYGAVLLPRDKIDVYAFRSSLASMTLLVYDLKQRDVDWRPLKALTEEWRRITSAGYFYGDYYPLTPYNRDETQWMAWQFHRPDRNAGLVQAFRRKDSPVAAGRFRLRGLEPDVTYDLTNLDAPGKTIAMTGDDLITTGVTIETNLAPQAALIIYQA
jgi:alpha-galactosidase